MIEQTQIASEMNKSTEVIIRAYTGQDEAALLELWNQTLTRDTITSPTFHAKVILDYNFQPENLLLAFENEKLCGFVLSVFRRIPMLWEGLDEQTAWITAFGVSKEARRRGIATTLFETVEQRFREKGFSSLQISPYTPNYFTPGVDCDAYPDAVHFLQNRGYRIIDQPVSMQIDLLNFTTHEKVLQTQHNLEKQYSIQVREVRGEDLPGLVQLIAEYFGAEWLRHARQYLLEKMHTSPQEIGFFVAVQGSKVVGYCQFKKERFGPFGVLPELRNLGLGAVLLNYCLEAMKACGYRVAWFLWAEVQVARLYERTGFTPVRQFFIFEKSSLE
jgi:ribosomal protein S18 acetylase RimI-like enzyme